MKKNLITALFLTVSWASIAQTVIEGKVRDGSNLGVAGAAVLEKGSSNYVLTDIEGNFSLPISGDFPISLQVSSVGFFKLDIAIYERPKSPLILALREDNLLSSVTVTARRRSESIQDVPVAVSVVGGDLISESGAFNVNLIKELVPSVQLYSSNPRNTTLNIRGLGSTFGLTNDGIDPGVGFYVDGVYYARPAAATLDFIDIDQIEVLKGPQGTLFGKNTTAGAFNITTKKPTFTPEGKVELGYGNYGFIQAKTSLSGKLIRDKLAGRISFSGTQRDGTIYNVRHDEHVNDLNNLGARGQLLFVPNDKIELLLSADASSQKPNGYAQVFAGTVTTQRPDFRQFDNIIADLGYKVVSNSPYERVIDTDTPWRSLSQLGGLSLNAEFHLGEGTLTTTSAWRYWNWNPSSDRDFIGLPALTLSQAPSRHDQWSQEIRYVGDISRKMGVVVGLYALSQDLQSSPFHSEESGPAQWRFVQNTQDPLWETPGLLDGYGIRTTSKLQSLSTAAFANLDIAIRDKFHLLPGLRFNYDKKEVDYERITYGGLQTGDPELLALQSRVFSPQQFHAKVDNGHLTGQLTIDYRPSGNFSLFGTISTNYKPIGINLGGLPTENGQPLLELAEIKPEFVTHYELGLKSSPWSRATLNASAYFTQIENFQTLVQSPELGVNRGYLANAAEVAVKGFELDGAYAVGDHLTFFGSAAYTDGRYITFTNAPVPLEEVGGEQAFKDISGQRLPGISTWAGSIRVEWVSSTYGFFNHKGNWFISVDSYFRSEFSSSPSPSRYLNIDGYGLCNARAGFRVAQGLAFNLWSRNLLDQHYFEQLLPASGSTGHYAAVLGDPRTLGVTFTYIF